MSPVRRGLAFAASLTATWCVGLFVAAIWTTGTLSDRLAGTAFLALGITLVFCLVFAGVDD